LIEVAVIPGSVADPPADGAAPVPAGAPDAGVEEELLVALRPLHADRMSTVAISGAISVALRLITFHFFGKFRLSSLLLTAGTPGLSIPGVLLMNG
jgi:hypothetical protein